MIYIFFRYNNWFKYFDVVYNKIEIIVLYSYSNKFINYIEPYIFDENDYIRFFKRRKRK